MRSSSAHFLIIKVMMDRMCPATVLYKGDNVAMEKIKIERTKENVKLMMSRECDKYDYLTAVACGVVGGLSDIFLVGIPGDSVLEKVTDKIVDGAVYKFAKLLGWKAKGKETDDISHAIAFLEKKFKVNYDQQLSSSASEVTGITMDNHHMKSLAHSPDIIGLFFSILNQFTNTSTFFSDGQIITIDTKNQELVGKTIIAKFFCGFVNWFGHLMSDVAGAHGSREKGNMGDGIVMPFYELLNACNFGNFKVGDENMTLAELATKAFESGYDFRFGLAQSIPVLLTDLLIRFIWAFRQRFQFKKPLIECIPVGTLYGNLRVSLLIGKSTLCLIDVSDAAIQSAGNPLLFFMRLNLKAWYKLVLAVIKEACIRLGIEYSDSEEAIHAVGVVNQAVQSYLKELEELDIELFKKESKDYENFSVLIISSDSEEALNKLLLSEFKNKKIKTPWEGDFKEFMSDKNNRLVFD